MQLSPLKIPSKLNDSVILTIGLQYGSEYNLPHQFLWTFIFPTV